VWKIGLGFLTFGASFDIFFHKLSELGSFVWLLHELPCVWDPWMASCRAIVDFSQHSSSFLDVILEKKFSDHWFGVGKKGVIKEDMWLVGIHLLVKVLSSGEEIGDGVGVSRDVGQFIIEILEVLDPMSLTAGDILGLTEILEVLVVSMNLNQVCHSKKQGVTTLESKDDHGKLLVMGVVVLFGGEETSWMESDQVDSIVEFLSYNSSKGISQGVSFKDKSLWPIGAVECGEFSTHVLQALEGLLFVFCPLPLPVLACEVIQRSWFIWEVGDEDSIEVAEA
jgi:hypothetical protein